MKIIKFFHHQDAHHHKSPINDPVIESGTDKKDKLYGDSGHDALLGKGGNDKIYGFKGNDFLSGGTGKDHIYGGRGADTILGGDGKDKLHGQFGNDYINGGEGNDKIYGGWGHDILIGGLGRDKLYGGLGNDWLQGGFGNDRYHGGHGADTYLVNVYQNQDQVLGSGRDQIHHFKHDDKLAFNGNIQSLDALDAAILTVKQIGSSIKIKFLDNSILKIHGLKTHDTIDDIYDLADKIHITFVNEYRNIDGSYNNLSHSDYGQTATQFIRKAPSDYADGYSEPSGSDRPSARVVSNEVAAQDSSHPNPFHASDMFWLWGQFIDHDIDLIMGESDELMPITVPLGDPQFDPYYTGTQTISLHRSAYDESTGYDTPREHINGITAFIDASMVYGSDLERAQYLRAEGGYLKLSDNGLLPYNLVGLDNAGGPDPSLFLAGDVRANENVALTSMHTLFVREHNRLVDEIKSEHPEYNSEQLYQEAKRIVEAEIQAITYNEFLPLLLGADALPEYTGYNPDINPQISNLFAGAAYRLGHTLLSTEVERLNEDGSIAGSHLALRDAFFRPDILLQGDQISNIFRGVAEGLSETLDTFIVEDVRSFLFGPPGAGGLDLAALNIQRGRDHGLPDYNTVRDSYGLEKVSSFSEITSDLGLQVKLEALYGDVNNIDLFVGGLSEDAVEGSMLGELFQSIILDQFVRLRDGDRFYYEDRLSEAELDKLDHLKLSDIIENNTDVNVIQDNPFLAYQRTGGTEADDDLIGTSGFDLLIGFAGEDTLFGLGGNDELFGLEDDDILTGGYGKDRFVHRPGDGHDFITDFHNSEAPESEQDKIDLTAHETDFSQLTITADGDNTVIHIYGNDQVTVAGLSPDQITEQDFVF